MFEVIVAFLVVVVIELLALTHSLNAVARCLSHLENLIRHSSNERLDKIVRFLSMIEDRGGRPKHHFIQYRYQSRA